MNEGGEKAQGATSQPGKTRHETRRHGPISGLQKQAGPSGSWGLLPGSSCGTRGQEPDLGPDSLGTQFLPDQEMATADPGARPRQTRGATWAPQI